MEGPTFRVALPSEVAAVMCGLNMPQALQARVVCVPHRREAATAAAALHLRWVQCMRRPPHPLRAQRAQYQAVAPALEGCPAQPWVAQYHAEHKPSGLRSSTPTNSQSRWRAARMCIRMRAATARADSFAAGCACAARCVASGLASIASHSRCHKPLDGPLGGPSSAVIRQGSGLRCGVALSHPSGPQEPG